MIHSSAPAVTKDGRARDARLEALLPSLANGVRAAVATLVPFFLAAALGRAELAWMALGGWLGTLADPGGLRTTRAKALGAFVLLGVLLVPLAERCAGSVVLATAAVVLVAFVATLARALGSAAATVGTLVTVTVAVAAARVGATSGALDATFFAAGALWATVLSSLVWPVGLHRPVRMAVSTVFEELAAYARAIDAVALAEPPGEAWSRMTRVHHRVIREALESAFAIALAVRARRPGESAVGGDLRELVGLAEQQFPQLIALAEELEATPIAERSEHVRRRLRELAATYDAVRARLRARKPEVLAAPPAAERQPGDDRGAGVLSLGLRKGGAQALALASTLGSGGAIREAEPEGAALRRAFADDLRELRDALSIESVFFRHAVRVAVAVGVASVVGHLVSTRPHWITVTALAVLQPYPGPTSTRAAERVVGTVLGSAVAAAITMTVHSPLVLAAIMFPLSVAAVATKPRSYRLFTFFLTPVFVLIAESHPGDWWTAAARAGDSVIGGAIALAAALVVLPAWEKGRLPEALAKMVAAVDVYRVMVLGGLERPDDDTTRKLAGARRAAGVAIGEAEASLERYLAEPLRSPVVGESAMQQITHARRLANACTALYTHASHGIDDAVTREVHLHAIEGYAATLQRVSTRPPAPRA
ncbi:MAG: putative rane protein [Labilithrix sp.]|nr:putative rane protein [Labilithrix sp.]